VYPGTKATKHERSMKQKFRSGSCILLTFVLLTSHDLFAAGVFPGGKPNGLVLGFSLFLGLVVALAVHELGHLLTGLAQGFRFELFVVFLLGIKRTDKGIRVYLNKEVGYMGGIAATIPTTSSPKNRKRLAYTVLAGPLASLLFAAVCLLLVVFTRNILWTFWLMASTTSFGLFFATTVPYKSGIFFTDRARFQRLISKGPEGKAEEALLELIAQSTVDNSYKNISLENARLLQTDKETFVRFWGYYYEYEYFKANENPVEAETVKAELILLKDSISHSIWKALKLDP
jgi:Peptidase family M50